MIRLATVVRVAIALVLFGALFLLLDSPLSGRDLATAAGLLVLGAIHVLYWWRGWPSSERRAVGAAAAMVLINLVLLDEGRGFRLRVRLGAAPRPRQHVEFAR